MQTAIVRVPPPTLARTRWMFGYWRRLLTLWAWLIWWPTIGPFPQSSHRVVPTASPS